MITSRESAFKGRVALPCAYCNAYIYNSSVSCRVSCVLCPPVLNVNNKRKQASKRSKGEPTSG